MFHLKKQSYFLIPPLMNCYIKSLEQLKSSLQDSSQLQELSPLLFFSSCYTIPDVHFDVPYPWKLKVVVTTIWTWRVDMDVYIFKYYVFFN